MRQATEQLYHPLGGQGRQTADGIKLLRDAALDIPVYLVRLEAGYVQRTLHQVSADLISEGRLIEGGVTGYAAAFQRGEQRVLILVSRAPLRRPLREAVIWQQRDQDALDTPEPPPPAPPPEPPPAPLPRRKRSKGNPETRKARKKARKLKRRQEQ